MRARLENPYHQYFSGELSFRQKPAFDRSSLTAGASAWARTNSWPDPGEPVVGHKTGALATKDAERWRESTAKPKATPSTDAGRRPALQKSVKSARRHRVELRQSYLRWPSEPPSWSGATPMPINSSALVSARVP